MLTAVILVISMAVSVSAESGTNFSFTLKEEEETIITDYEIPKDNATNSDTDKTISPETGESDSLVLWIVLLVSSSCICGVLYHTGTKIPKQ